MVLQTKSGAPVGRAVETATKMATQHKRIPDNIVVCKLQSLDLKMDRKET
jgi:hypothetical protein